jgi:hypothetical protein
MMSKMSLFTLPCPSTALISEPVLSIDGSDLLLAMDFDDEGKKRSATLRFVKQRAFKERGEIYCTGWHVKDSYDTVCEVKESDWVKELLSAAAPDKRDSWIMRHFMIYIDSFGCLEVVSESVEISQTD